MAFTACARGYPLRVYPCHRTLSVALDPARQATIFLYRDPRDMIVSHVFYATDLYEGHGMHRYYEQLDSMEARMNAAIEGVADPEFFLSSVRERYDLPIWGGLPNPIFSSAIRRFDPGAGSYPGKITRLPGSARPRFEYRARAELSKCSQPGSLLRNRALSAKGSPATGVSTSQMPINNVSKK